jgi:hypothetical protein
MGTLPSFEVEGQASMEPWEAGHYLGTGNCSGEGELPLGERDRGQGADQQEHPPNHTTKLESNTSTRVLSFCSGVVLLAGCGRD